ncbi:PTS system IIB component, Fru family [Pelosinus propionicus DSM 13327]|uniref:PTS system IIB component, Fru family n=1 Tax=Pelosinus propionicus DSM 13327 TaxID=1123291 RepID=A0A1I4KAM9_9FIRM|nr:PTS system IIB component, Fru family [Pelosinus propionicus DSM 13327]
MKMIGVCACPTGIAHTYMAQAALEKAARAKGHEIKVETQGAMGIENELSAGEIADARVVIFAVGVNVEGEERFDGKQKVTVEVGKAIENPMDIIQKAEMKGMGL